MMANRKNYLLGRGEELTKPVVVPSGGGDKNPPYDFPTARRRLAPLVSSAAASLAALPSGACPNDEAVVALTLHPRYLAKSDFPNELLTAIGLRAIGSKVRNIVPGEWGITKPPEGEVPTTELFVAGKRSALTAWRSTMSSWGGTEVPARQLARIENVHAIASRDKVRGIVPSRSIDDVLLEIVIHTAGRQSVVDSFADYARQLGAAPDLDRRRDVGGLCFIPTRARPDLLERLAQFAFLRALRGMPSLRPWRPNILRRSVGFKALLPSEGALDPNVRAVVFDGGIPDDVDLGRWVQVHDAPGVSAPVADYQRHGLMVTSALLYGPLANGVMAPQPFVDVDHYRVLGVDEANSTDDLYDVLARIVGVLEAHRHRYHFVNISIGPNIAAEDDDVNAWTATLDDLFARSDVLATVAVGNNGELDAPSGLNRVQPPGDGVNVLAVGACNSLGDSWERAAYSCVGPGRSPGVMKPDGVAFGGSDSEPFHALADGKSRTSPEQGTSFAAPFVLRAATGVRATLGDKLTPLSTRALLIHRAGRADGHVAAEVGWGRFPVEMDALLTCEDHEVVVVYQGHLPVGTHLRAAVPIPKGVLRGNVVLAATLCIAPRVDPEHPVMYTRAGLEVAFRPNALKHNTRDDGGTSAHAKTVSFFSESIVYGGEVTLREDAHKWEPCLRARRTFRGSSLVEPCFDIYYHHREEGQAGGPVGELPYALVVSLHAPRVTDLYDQVVRAYSAILQPLQPRTRIPIRI